MHSIAIRSFSDALSELFQYGCPTASSSSSYIDGMGENDEDRTSVEERA